MLTLRALLADDEASARRLLRELLRDVPWLGEIREVGDGQAALAAIETFSPDIVFLDVAMPGLSGTRVAERAPRIPFLVFTTAYDQYAAKAYELEAFDYLLKPFGPRRLGRVLERVEAACSTRRVPALEHLFARVGSDTLRIPVSHVEHLQGWDDFVAVHYDGRRVLCSMTLSDCVRQLDPSRFVRVHRSHIVNLDHVKSYSSIDGDRVRIVLKSGTRIVASRAGSRLLRRLGRNRRVGPGERPA